MKWKRLKKLFSKHEKINLYKIVFSDAGPLSGLIMSGLRWRLTVVGETYLKFLACEEYTAFHGAEREIHLLCNLVVLVAGDVH